ncbi:MULTISPECIES: DUF1127 domain-containing protein [Pseudomonas]|uniref:DUF1127 domain-containing protein n=1 Tax=Pseudomonas protegens TaxID=380021 RepID=A0A2T6GJI7_9PSED|nr:MULTISPECIES: DUF1127 domain-containing protein [Pseudomonas]PUA44329.1 DUF1127 domain-containing protein [Pseudomonas protegens]RXU66314.1 DUF1127 domain-containing protein [Pseudomonas protegens]ULT70644.1 DUF1127 domain-containing protein [Pseudomonas sp. BC42]BAQ71811.1 uncharacterized protein POS17_0117 [Pseudomonas sp. Os17]BAQ78004.1 uncharacterized protein PST29_0115 [Pseudomonas sp. St29]
MDSCSGKPDTDLPATSCSTAFKRWITALASMMERARTRRLLAQMDERQLSDSGISHGDRAAELHKPFWR